MHDLSIIVTLAGGLAVALAFGCACTAPRAPAI
jgi:hypothetical protein